MEPRRSDRYLSRLLTSYREPEISELVQTKRSEEKHSRKGEHHEMLLGITTDDAEKRKSLRKGFGRTETHF